MCKFVRPIAGAFSFACLVASTVMMSNGGALAQAKEQAAPAPAVSNPVSEIKQFALTEKQIRGVIAASSDVDAVTDVSDPSLLDAKTKSQLDTVVRKHGLAGFDEYSNVNENIGLVTSGIDPATRKYVGKEARLKAQIARARADKKMSAVDKKETLTDLNDQLQFPLPPVQYKSNIDLVIKYYDGLMATATGD